MVHSQPFASDVFSKQSVEKWHNVIQTCVLLLAPPLAWMCIKATHDSADPTLYSSIWIVAFRIFFQVSTRAQTLGQKTAVSYIFFKSFFIKAFLHVSFFYFFQFISVFGCAGETYFARLDFWSLGFCPIVILWECSYRWLLKHQIAWSAFSECSSGHLVWFRSWNSSVWILQGLTFAEMLN